MGVGLVEPEDDLRLTNPPSNESLFTALENDFIENGYDIKRLIRLIMRSAAYQRSSRPVSGNETDTRHYSHYYPRRLPAEVILDAYSSVTDAPTPFSGYPEGWRALQLPDNNVASAFLQTFGSPERKQTCSCERDSTPTLSQALHISNGDTLNEKLRREGNRIDHALDQSLSIQDFLFDLYLSALSRLPTKQEEEAVLTNIENLDVWNTWERNEKRQLLEDITWAVLSGKEFLFNH